MELSLKSRRALVLGASQGIGAAAACELAALGASVVMVARREDVLRERVKQLPNVGQNHSYLICDVSDREQLKKQVLGALGEGAFSVLINNTGGPAGGPILEAKEEAFSETFAKHVLVNSMLAQCLVPGMKAQGYGRIINVISTSVKIPIPNLGVSNTVRAAVANWAKTLSQEVAPFGITVNNVLPGMTRTERLDAIIENNMKSTQRTRQQVEDDMRKSIPAGRFGSSEEIAAAIAFLATPAAAYINGVSLAVDGGRTGCH